VGSTTTATGSGFLADQPIDFALDSVASASSCSSNASGGFSCVVTIPTVPNGPQTLNASDGTNNASTSFSVEALVMLYPVQGPVGSTTTANGSGFDASATISFTLASTTAPSTCSSNSSGNFTCVVTIPAVPHGTHTLGASDGVNSAPATFTVTSSLSVLPTRGIVGSAITATGGGFNPSRPISFTLDDVSATSSCFSNSTGGFACSVTIPSVPNGGQILNASDAVNTATSILDVEALVSLNPSSGIAGSTTTAVGAGFDASQTITFTLDSIPAASTCSSNLIGSFSCTVTIPAVPHGTHTLAAFDGVNTAPATFAVKAFVALSPISGVVGTTTEATGTGFIASHSITFSLDSIAATATCSSNSSGSFACTVTIPAVSNGPQTMVASDGTNTAAAGFNVIVPAILLTPAQGPIGALVAVSGTEFIPSTPLTSLDFDGVMISTCVSGSLTSDDSGSFSCTFVVPSGTVGTTVRASGIDGRSATGSFTVTALSVAVTPGQGPVGASVTVSGSGFSVSSSLASVIFDGATVTGCTIGSLTTSGSGAFTCTLAVPSSTTSTLVEVTDAGGQSGESSFTVTVPALSLSSTSGVVGSAGIATGSGLAVSMAYSLTWDSSTTLCGGSTSAVGAFSCNYIIPNATAGSHNVTGVQGVADFSAQFLVVPSISSSASNGSVGDQVTISGNGFGPIAPFSVTWNGVTTVCTGVTNNVGGFSCGFLVPAGPVGPVTITATEGVHAQSLSFTVSASPPPPSGAAPFPWWAVGVIAVVVALLLCGLLLYEQRRHHSAAPGSRRSRSGGSVSAWNESNPSAGGAVPTASTPGTLGGGAGTDTAGLVAAYGFGAGATEHGNAPAGATPGEPEDIDVLIGRLERMSQQMFNKHPKELANEPAAGETIDSEAEK
jgi:hypothetical protein